MDDFEQELKNGFLEEASQLLSEAEQCFLALESDPQNMPNLEKIFRIAHNIKGSSRAVGFDALGAFTHEFESFLLKCKSGMIPITNKTVSLLLTCNDHVKLFVESLKADPAAQIDSMQLILEIQAFKPEDSAAEGSVAAPVNSEQEESISIEEVMLQESAAQDIPLASDFPPEFSETESQAEVLMQELASHVPQVTPVPLTVVSAAPAQVPTNSGAVKVPPIKAPAAQSDESIRVSLNRLERLLNFVGELVILQTVLREQALSEDPVLFRRTIQQMGKVTKEVQDISMSLRMVPLKQTFQKMQRIVRDTASTLGKKVNLVLEGEETEVDKTVLESLSDPLVHLIRNAVDHGIESGEVRIANGKSETGTVALKAYQQSGKLIIEVKDNGGGIPADRLRAKALEKGILKPGQTISDQQAVELVFHPGFSTKAQVTEVSGRGVGMDVVKTNIEKMQGEVLIETHLGSGSTFKIVLPLTMAIIDAMVVRCADERFIIPRSHVHESIKLQEKDVQFATGTGEVLYLRGENLPVVHLARSLGRKAATRAPSIQQIAIIVRSQGRPFAVIVDEIIGQHQVVIKKLGNELQSVKGFSGSAILGDGRPALILELGDLLSVQTSKLQGA